MDETVPHGFLRLARGGPFLAALGALYYRKVEDGRFVIAMRVTAEHTNVHGIAHGGMLATLADSALGLSLSLASEGRQSYVTVNLTTDFADAAHPGDWIEAPVDIQRVGRRFAFANCFLTVGEKRILRASGVFAVMPPLNGADLAQG